MVAAFWTEFIDFAATSSKAPDATVTHDFATPAAAVGAADARVPRTYQRPVRKDHRRSDGRRNMEARNADLDTRGFRKKLDLSKTQ